MTSVAGQLPSADPEIWSVRLRSFNAVGNPNFEVSQRNLTNSVSTGMSVDRWWPIKTGTMVYAAVQGTASGAELVVPGTNFQISRSFQRLTLSTAQATLAAGDMLNRIQGIEGLYFRELQYDVHSISILCRSSVAGLKFSLSLRDSTNANSLCKLCTIPSARTPGR